MMIQRLLRNGIGWSHSAAVMLATGCVILLDLAFAPFAAAPQAGSSRAPQPSAQVSSAFVETIPGTPVKFEMISIVAGAARDTAISNSPGAFKPIWMGKKEVTWDEYDLWAFRLDLRDEQRTGEMDGITRPSKPYGAPDRGFGHNGFPALGLTFHAAQEYCRWLSLKTGKRYRLPTEAEWETACRAGSPANSSRQKLDEEAWYWDNAEDQTHRSGSKQANPRGLHDMLGNVAEWVIGNNGTPMVAGGSFRDRAGQIQCGARAQQLPAWNVTDPQFPKSKWWLSDAPFVGFRVVCEM